MLADTPVPRGFGAALANRVAGPHCWEGLELCAGKLACTVNKPDFAPNATSESHGSRVGGFTTASPVCWVVQRVRKTASPPTRRSTVMARIRFVGINAGLPVARPKTGSGFCEALDLALDANFPGPNDLDFAGNRILAVWFRSTLLTAYT